MDGCLSFYLQTEVKEDFKKFEAFGLLGWYTTQLASYWRFGTVCRSPFQWPSIAREPPSRVKQYKKCYCTVWPFNMGPVRCPETSVTFHKVPKASKRPQRLAGISGRNRVQWTRSHSDCLLFFPPALLLSFFRSFSRCLLNILNIPALISVTLNTIKSNPSDP